VILRLILAAGEGRRLGEAKATAMLAGTSFLERVLAGPLPPGGRSLVVTGAHRAQTEGEARRLNVETLHNPGWAKGQSSSLAAGLEAVPESCSGVLLHPVDFPLVRIDDYRRLLATWDACEDDPRRIAVVSHSERRGHPILFAPTWIPELQRVLAEGGHARQVFRAAGPAVRYALVDHDGVRRDIDTPADLAAAEALLGAD
jgi:molybdenum cofactor cytidylyltransferase